MKIVQSALPASPKKYIINFSKNTHVFLTGLDTTNIAFPWKLIIDYFTQLKQVHHNYPVALLDLLKRSCLLWESGWIPSWYEQVFPLCWSELVQKKNLSHNCPLMTLVLYTIRYFLHGQKQGICSRKFVAGSGALKSSYTLAKTCCNEGCLNCFSRFVFLDDLTHFLLENTLS